MMFAWVLGVPVLLLVTVLALGWLETRMVAPFDRATRISTLIQHSEPEVLEREVAVLLAPVTSPPAPVTRSSKTPEMRVEATA
jgi:hypothetical protein